MSYFCFKSVKNGWTRDTAPFKKMLCQLRLSIFIVLITVRLILVFSFHEYVTVHQPYPASPAMTEGAYHSPQSPQRSATLPRGSSTNKKVTKTVSKVDLKVGHEIIQETTLMNSFFFHAK